MSQGKVSEKSGNLDMDIEWQPCQTLLAHLSQRLIGELIVYSCSGVRPSSSYGVVRRSRPQIQTSSSPKPLGQSKPNFMWSLLGLGERYFVSGIWVT